MSVHKEYLDERLDYFAQTEHTGAHKQAYRAANIGQHADFVACRKLFRKQIRHHRIVHIHLGHTLPCRFCIKRSAHEVASQIGVLLYEGHIGLPVQLSKRDTGRESGAITLQGTHGHTVAGQIVRSDECLRHIDDTRRVVRAVFTARHAVEKRVVIRVALTLAEHLLLKAQIQTQLLRVLICGVENEGVQVRIAVSGVAVRYVAVRVGLGQREKKVALDRHRRNEAGRY